MKKNIQVVLLLCLLIPVSASSSLYSDIYVFGDSLSDTDIFKNGSNYRGSNGPLWIEYLSPELGVSYDRTKNYAQYGATTGEIKGQVDSYLSTVGGSADPDALYAVWGGPNDLFDNIDSLDLFSPTLPNDISSIINTGIANLITAISSLSTAGANNILVPNMPNLGVTPGGILLDDYLATTPGLAGFVGLAEGASQEFNTALAAALMVSSIDVILIDVFSELNDVVADPAAFGFTNVVDGCVSTLLGDPETSPGFSPCPGYMYFDIVHPTTAAHAVLAQHINSALVPAPATVVLMAIGITGIGYFKRRGLAASRRG